MTIIGRKDESHNGRELALMLAGKKPMAVFSKLAKEYFDQFAGQDFRRYVTSGDIIKRKFYVPYKSDQLIYTCFFLPAEEWRFYCYRSVVKLGAFNWSDEKEAVLSLLLGYSLSEASSYIASRS